MQGNAFSLKGLFLAVTLMAVGLFALVNASPLWASIVVAATLVALLTALLAVVCQPGPRRAFWVGFAIFGWGYLVLLETPLGESYRQNSPTHAALEGIYGAIRREIDPAKYEERIPGHNLTSRVVRSPDGVPISVAPVLIFPNEGYFQQVGHYLWAWVLALVGGFFARHLYVFQERRR